MKFASLAVAALALIASSPVAATDYIVSFDSGLGSFSGTFTTSVDPNPNFDLVTAITGTFGGNAVTLLPLDSVGGNDNLFSPTSPFTTANGIAFSTSAGSFDLYTATPTLLICGSVGVCIGNPVTNFSVQAAGGAVPEPATWAMMLLGFGAIGFQIRRGRVRPQTA